jgi:hypothetical protein
MNGLKKGVCVFLLGFLITYINAENLEDRVEALEETVRQLVEMVDGLMQQLPAQEGATLESPQAVPARGPESYGESQSLSIAQEQAAENYGEYRSPRSGVNTDRGGHTEIIYGDEKEADSRTTRPISEQIISVDMGPARELLVVADVEELVDQRAFIRRVDPDLPRGSLPEGLRSLDVFVQFAIENSGIVREVMVDDTGKPLVNTLIEQAIRRWKFSRIRADKTVTVRLMYRITTR